MVNNMRRAGAVVLNYKNYQDTIVCGDSILMQTEVDVEIVIVDNFSQNNSVEVLINRYKGLKNVQVIGLNDNLGYAKGNNQGIKQLRDMGISYIFIANSDLKFESTTIFKELMEAKEGNVGLLVPTIRNLDGKIEKRVVYKKKYLYLRMIKELIKDIIGISLSTNNEIYDKNMNNVKNDIGIQTEKYVVSGSGYMLLPIYFKCYQGLYSETFLYGEECATILLLHKAKLLTKIVETQTITHKGGVSTADKLKRNTSYRRKINIGSDKKVLKLLFMPYHTIIKKY